MGDMPYRQGDIEKVDRLIQAINASKPAFTIHVGDIISGRTRCTDENLTQSARQLDQLEAPLIYTPATMNGPIVIVRWAAVSIQSNGFRKSARSCSRSRRQPRQGVNPGGGAIADDERVRPISRERAL